MHDKTQVRNMLDHKLFYNDAMPIVDDLKLLFKEIDLQTCSKEIIFNIIEKLTHIDDNLKVFDEKEIEQFTKKLKDLTIAIYKKKIPLDNDTLQLLFNSIDLIEILCFKYIFRYKIEDIHENIYASLSEKLTNILSSLDPQDIELEDPLVKLYFNNHDKVILFVDDSIMIRKICERVAHTKGYKVMIANDGLHGLRLAMKYPFDLIFSDVNMPKVDGLEMIGAIRKITHHKFTPIVMLTTERDPDMMNYARAKGVRAWLTKPFTKEKLFETFQKLLE